MKSSLHKFRSSYLLLLLMAVGVFGCKKDSDPTPDGGDGVVGTWSMSALKVNPAIDGVSDYIQFLNSILGNDCLTRITFTFKNDGSLTGNVPQDCQTAEDAAEDFGVSQDSRWKVEGNKIILTEGTDVNEYDLEVNRTTMGWSYDELDDDGVNHRWTIEFKRK